MYKIVRADERHRKDINRMIRGAWLGPGLSKDEPVQNFWVVKDKGVVIACAGMDFHNDAAILTYIVVAEEYRHRGIGARLVAHRLNIARERGIKTVALATMYYRFNFYKKRGLHTCPRKNLPANIKEYPMFTDPRYMKCAVMWGRLK